MSDFVNTVDSIGDGAITESLFDRSITELNCDHTVKLREAAFRSCTSLTSVNLPSVTSLGNEAFRSCTSLTSVNLPSLTEITGMEAFRDDRSLTSVNLPSLKKPGSNTFYNCSALMSIDLPSLTSIGNNMFEGCTKLMEIKIPAVTYVYSGAFHGCSSLTYLDMPAVRTFSYSVFHNCSNLIALILRSETIATAGGSLCGNSSYPTPIYKGTGYIYVPSALLSDEDETKDYRRATNWSTYASQFRVLEEWTVDGTTTGEMDIENRCMARFLNNDGTLLGYKVITKGSTATWDGDTPVYIGADAADWGEFIRWIPEPNNVTSDMNCYPEFEYLGYIYKGLIDRSISGEYVNETVENIGAYAFAYCSNLTTVDFSAVTSMGRNPFRYCSNLTALILRSGTIVTLEASNPFENTPIASGTGYIYVPRALLSDEDKTKDYRRATYWSTYANQFRAIEDYPEVTGGEIA